MPGYDRYIDQYFKRKNIRIVTEPDQLQASVDAAHDKFASTGEGQTIIDYTGAAYTPAAGVSVEYQHKSNVGRPCSILTRVPGSLASYGYTADSGTSLGVGTSTFWPMVQKVKNLRAVFSNDSCDFTQTTEIVVHASVIDNTRSDAPVTIPLTFGGKPTITIAAHGVAISDPLPNMIDTDALEVRAYATAAHGNKIPCARRVVMGYGWTADKGSKTDYTSGGTFTDTPGLCGFAPIFITGESINGNEAKVFVIGDSIIDYKSEGTAYYSGLRTIFQQALDNYDVPSWICGFSGAHPVDMQAAPYLLSFLAGADTVISAFGRNAIPEGADAFEAQMSLFWQTLRAQGVKKIYQVNITPHTKWSVLGTDTPSNQVEYGTNFDTTLKACNTWLETQVTAGVIDGVIDWASPVTEEYNGVTCWKTGMADYSDLNANTSLLHPSRLGVYAMAQAIDLESIGLPAKTPQPDLWTRPDGALVDIRLLETAMTDSVVNSASGSSAAVANASAAYPPIDISPFGAPCRKMIEAHGKMNVTGLSFPDTTKFTFLAWAYFNHDDTNRDNVLYAPNGTNVRFYMHYDATGGVKYLYPSSNTGSGSNAYDSSIHIGRNTWCLVGFTIDLTAGEMYFYINGVKGAKKTPNIASVAHTTANIGNDDGWAPVCLLGEVLIYNKALTPAEVLAIYTNSKSRYISS